MADFHARIPDKLNDALDEEAKRQKISKNELVQTFLEKGLKGGKEDQTPALRHIPLKYPAKCKTCGKSLEEGQWAFWGKSPEGSIVICTDCEIRKFGDKATVRKLYKVEELKYQKQVLEKEISGLLDKYREFNFYEVMEAIHSNNQDIVERLKDYLDKVATPEEKTKLDALLKAVGETKDRLEEAREFMAQPWTKKKKKKAQMVT